MLMATYMRDENAHDLYKVRCLGQTIVVSRNILIATIGMSSRCKIGCSELTHEQAERLGFIVSANKK